MTVPASVKNQHDRLIEICNKYPTLIPVNVCADFLGIHKDTMRELIDQGRCPFAVCTNDKAPAGRRYFIVPMLAFFNYFTQGGLFRSDE